MITVWACVVTAVLAYQAGRWFKRRDISSANRRDWREIHDLRREVAKLRGRP